MPRPLIIAHRGASAEARENSLEAFERAVGDGADMIEFDLRRTADGQIVAFHDAAVGGRPVAELSRAELADATGSAPAVLEEILALAKGRIGLDAELKVAGLTDTVLAAVRRDFGAEDVVVTSFLDGEVAVAAAAWPEVRAGLLVEAGTPPADCVRRARACGARLLGLEATIERDEGSAWAVEAGLEVAVWTVNDHGTIQRLLADPDVAAVITDVPDLAVAVRDGAA